jgi:outer membrane biosynthesis protein TonB
VRRLGTGALLLCAALVLTGCASDARGDLREAVADLTADANAGDAAAVRSGVDAFLALVDRAVRDGEIDTAEGVRLAEIAQRLRAGADALEAPEPTPEPTTEEPSPEPTTEEPSPEPTTQRPTPSPTPAEDDDEDDVEQTPSPTPSPSSAPPTVLPELTPAAATSPSSSPSPATTPAR